MQPARDLTISSQELKNRVINFHAKQIQRQLADLESFYQRSFAQVVKSAEQGISHVYCYVDRAYELDSIQVQARFRRMFTNCSIQIINRAPILNRSDEFVDCVHVSW